MSNLFDLTGQCAFITGGTRGIGRAIAEAFVDHGARIGLTCHIGDEALEVAAAINRRVGREAAIGIEADLADRDRSREAFDEVAAALGKIDILVCNAAARLDGFGPSEQFSPEEFLRVLEGNVVNNAALMNHAATAMKARRDGVLLATSSGSGVRPSYGVAPYGVSKAGLNHLVRYLSSELVAHNIRVNAVAPGFTRTDRAEQMERADPAAMAQILAGVPMGRMIEPAEIAAAMVFLAGPGGRAITGQTILIDGGEFCRGGTAS